MKRTVTALLALCFCFSLFSYAGSGESSSLQKKPKHSVKNNTYINKTQQCQVSVFNKNWKLSTQFEELGDGISIAEFDESVYSAWGVLAISKHPQKSLEEFAGKGTYDAEKAKYTFIAGKPAYAASKKMENRGFKISSQIYKFVHNDIGFIFSFSYLSKWDEDETLQAQIDEILNSFTFSDEQSVVQEMFVDMKTKKEKLTNIAMLGMIDLKLGEENEDTRILTNELQNQLNKTGQFEFIERRNLDQIAEEHKFQLTGMISNDSAIKVGEFLGAKYILSSNLGLIGKTSVIYAQITNTENGKIISSASIRVRKAGKDDLFDTIPVLVSKLLYEK